MRLPLAILAQANYYPNLIQLICHRGNLTALADTLTAQALALDTIFNEMARRAALNMDEYLNAAESYLRLGLKNAGTMPVNHTDAVQDEKPAAGRVWQANIAH